MSRNLLYKVAPGVGVEKEKKIISVSFRVSPQFKRALGRAAESVRRTQTNFLETIVFDYCERNGIDIEIDRDSAEVPRRTLK